ncbi:hypothetical protein L5515_011027 [Caenorhabditis briggsae]|uniref:C-type lectin domain-containing protein n=1 Tax=Caenorhabditis briggsae TaxID=6238 RepID=A0AAE9JGQ0_CAEBR|nr:hypothetical protein L5515_011027 [Caenorhabditis briggsae]
MPSLVSHGFKPLIKNNHNYNYYFDFSILIDLGGSIDRSSYDKNVGTCPEGTTGLKTCETGYEMFLRGEVWYCLKIIVNDLPLNQTEGQKLCGKEGAALSGLETDDEHSFVNASVHVLLRSNEKSKNATWGLWISGTKKDECEKENTTEPGPCEGINGFDFEDKTLQQKNGYKWFDGEPNNLDKKQYCIYMMIDNYRKSIRDFNIDWENCDEKYRWPACCLWSEKKMFQRTTSDCAYIKGDVILEKNDDALIFQSLLDLREIQGSLVLRNTTFLEFGLPSLQKLGFAGDTMNGKRQDAALIIENNPYLMHLRLRRVSQIVKHEDQKYAIIRGNPRIKIDEKQYEILKVASNGSTDFDQFEFPQEIYVRHLLYELWPYCLFGFMIIVVFTHHFIMLEVNESRVKKKEQEMIDCLVKMRDATLAAELL